MRLIIVDGHGLFREGLISLLEQEDGFQVVDQGSSIYDTIEKMRACQPDVLLLEALLPDGNGIEIVPTLLQLSPGTKIVLLTFLEDEQLYHKAFQYGAKGYLTKSTPYRQLIDLLRALGNGEAALIDNMAGQSPGTFPPLICPGNGKDDFCLRFLTHREREVLDQLGRGATN